MSEYHHWEEAAEDEEEEQEEEEKEVREICFVFVSRSFSLCFRKSLLRKML